MYELNIETILANYSTLKRNSDAQRIIQNYQPTITDFEQWLARGLLANGVKLFHDYLTLDMRKTLTLQNAYRAGLVYSSDLDDFYVKLFETANSQTQRDLTYSLLDPTTGPLSKRIRMEILKRDPWNIRSLINQTEEEIDYVIQRGQTYSFGGICGPTQEQAERIAKLTPRIPDKFLYSEEILQSLANHGALRKIPKNLLTRELLITALVNGATDTRTKFTDEELKTIIAKNSKFALRSKKAIRIGLQVNPKVMGYLDEVDNDIQVYWVEQDRGNFHCIRKPCNKVYVLYHAAYLGIDKNEIATFTDEYLNELVDILKLGDQI